MVAVIHPVVRDFALHAVARMHLRVSLVDLTALRHVTLSLVLIIVDTVDINDSIVFLARMALNLDDTIRSSLDLGLTATSAVQELLLLVCQLAGVL